MEKRLYNFAAGPSAMPPEVLERAQKDMLCYPGAGCSVMEMSHRSRPFMKIRDAAEESIRRLMDIPGDYAVLFLQGGASLQFSMVPMNLAPRGALTAYSVTGNFAKKAWEEACRWGDARIVASSEEDGFRHIPKIKAGDVPEDAAYLHITGNNTIFGTCYGELPFGGMKDAPVPLVADWSSAILGLEIDVRKHTLIYAGAQKNLGPAGLTLVIVKKDALLAFPDPVVPTMLRYEPQIKADSMYNTPPCWSIYMAGLMFEWAEAQGGVRALERRNREKAALLYGAIDSSEIFENKVAAEDRSITNVVFTLPDKELTDRFAALCEDSGIINIKGHRLVGGFRASLYNGVSMEAVRTLTELMKDFERGL